MNYEERIKNLNRKTRPLDWWIMRMAGSAFAFPFFRKNTRTMGRKPLTLMRGRLESR